MTEDPPVIVDQAQVSRIRAELTDSLEATQRQRRSTVWLAIAGFLVLFGCFTVAAWLGSGRMSETVWNIIFWVVFLLATLWLGLGLMLASFAKEECAQIGWRLQALDAEAVQTARALELAQSGSPFALFLRSFGAEVTGLSYASKERMNIYQGMERIQAARLGESLMLDTNLDHLVAYRKWSAQLEVLRSIQERYSTVLLGNTTLNSDMREELTRTGIIEVTIQAQEWWPIFLALSRHAYLIILYIETASPMLLREMQHIGSHRLRYAIFADDDELRRLAEEPSLGESFLSSAVARLKPEDVADLWSLKEM